MKRIATLAVILLLGIAAQAHSVRYFTLSQAQRTVRYLDAQNEMMIYCGYDYEIETYVLINEVWMERVNSAYYEIWVYGYDAYTGEEIYMPLDLGCVWLYSAGRMYNAAQYLRFHVSVQTPHLTWSVPIYNHYTRVRHHPGFTVTYHYHVHTHGWMPPAYSHHGPGMPPPPMHPYYMRSPNTPAPRPQAAWTPGVDRPQVVTGSSVPASSGRVTTGSGQTKPTTGGRTGGSSGVRTGNSGGQTGTSSATRTTPAPTTRQTGTTPTRGNATGTRTQTKDSVTTPATSTRSTGATGTRATGSTGSSSGTRTTGTTGTRSTGTTGTSSGSHATGTSASSTRSTGTASSRGTASGTTSGTATRSTGTRNNTPAR